MKKIIAGLLVSFSMQFASAQVPTQAEIDKLIKEAQALTKKYSNDSLLKKAIKNNAPGNTQFPGSKWDTTAFSIPARNNKLIHSLPIRCFNKTELISYLHNLGSKFSDYLRNKYGTDISGIPETVVEQPGAAIGLWMTGSIHEAVLITVKAAELHPENNLLLNNAGGILTSCGLGYFGIPVLEYVLEKQPGNNLIQNNLGQAYFDLGDDKKAEQYLLNCISSYKYYPDANLTLAYIYNSRGNKAAALNYVENSLRGGYSSKADNLLTRLKPNAKMIDYVRHRYKQPEYFQISKFQMLPQCVSVSQVAELEPQYIGYKKMIERAMTKYQKLVAQATLASVNSVQEEINAVKKTKQTPYRPFGMFGNAVLESLRREYKEKAVALEQYRKSYYRERDSVNKRYEKELKDIRDKYEKMDRPSDDDKCREITALNNFYLPLYSEPTEILQRKTLAYYKDYLNDMAYWSYVASINDDAFHMDYYRMITEFLGRLNEISTTRFMETKYDTHRFYPCDFKSGGSTTTADAEITTPDCYFTPKIEADLGAFKLEISCETYKIEAGEGLVGKMEYTRSSGDLTLAFGVGAAVPKVFFDSPGIKAGIEAEAKSQVYITFDRTMTPTDLGVLWEAELKGVIEMGKFKESVGHEEGLTAGFGSGVQLKDNSLLKNLIDGAYPVRPDDKQIDKRIPLYRK